MTNLNSQQMQEELEQFFNKRIDTDLGQLQDLAHTETDIISKVYEGRLLPALN